MKKLAISLIVILILSALSGCVDNKTENKGNVTSTENSEGIQTESKSDIKENVGTDVDKISVSSTSTETMTSSEWCIPGNKITASGEEFTIVGITAYKTYNEVCKAEKVTQDGSSTIYYNKGYVNNGKDKFFEMNSTGKNAKSSAIVTVGK